MTSVLMRAFQLRKIIQYQLHSVSNFDVFQFNFKHIFWSSHHSNCLPPILLCISFCMTSGQPQLCYGFINSLFGFYRVCVAFETCSLTQQAMFHRIRKRFSIIHALYDSCNKNVICFWVFMMYTFSI